MSQTEGILEELLECCICLDLCEPPIHQCKNGHNICGFHIPEIGDLCPICRVRYEFGGSRNLLAEHIISDILKNREKINVEKTDEKVNEEKVLENEAAGNKSDDQDSRAGAECLPRSPATNRMGMSILATQRTLTTNSTWPGAKPLKSLAVYSKSPPTSEFATPLKSLATYSPASPTPTTPTSPFRLFGTPPFMASESTRATPPRSLESDTGPRTLALVLPTIKSRTTQSRSPGTPPALSGQAPSASPVPTSPAPFPVTPPAVSAPLDSSLASEPSVPSSPTLPAPRRLQLWESSANDDKQEEDDIKDNIKWVKVDGQWIEQKDDATVSTAARPSTATTLVPDISLDTVRKKYETLSKVRGVGVLVTPWPPSSSTIRRASHSMGQGEDEN